MILNGKGELRDISIPSDSKHSLRTCLRKLERASPRNCAVDSFGRNRNQDDHGVKLECLDILSDLLKRFGKTSKASMSILPVVLWTLDPTITLPGLLCVSMTLHIIWFSPPASMRMGRPHSCKGSRHVRFDCFLCRIASRRIHVENESCTPINAAMHA